MPDVGTQLRSYFDEVVERITEEDVRIRASTGHGVPIPPGRFRPRPLAAAALGFGLALITLGVVLVVDRTLGTGATEMGAGGTAADPKGRTGDLWLFVPIVVGLGLLATGIASRWRHRAHMRSGGEETMQTIDNVDATEVANDHILRLKKQSLRLGWLSGILAIAVIGLGAWAIFDGGSDSTADLTPVQDQMRETIEASLAGWNSGDGAAVAATMAPTGYHDNGAQRIYVDDGGIEQFVGYVHTTGFSVSTSDYAFVGDFVITTDHIPADSAEERPSIFKMSPDGKQVLWHYAPAP